MLSGSLAETEKIVADFLVRLKPLPDRAVVVGLSGDLGSGKTTFSQSLAKQLGVVETVTSPTFVIQKIYLLNGNSIADMPVSKFQKLIHIDCYRLNGGAEMAKIGWAEIVADPENLIVVEWPEKIADILPADMIKVDFAFVDEATREISFHD